MNNDDMFFIILGSVAGFLIWLWILSEIIKGATRSAKIEQLLTLQTRLLMKLLQRNGVSNEEINEVLDLKTKVLK